VCVVRYGRATCPFAYLAIRTESHELDALDEMFMASATARWQEGANGGDLCDTVL